MKRNILVILLVLVATFSLWAQDSKVEPGVLRIKVTEELATTLEKKIFTKSASGTVATGVMALDQANLVSKANSIQRVFPVSPRYEERHRKHGLHLWYEVRIDASKSVTEAVASYAHVNGVAYVEPINKKSIAPFKAIPFDGNVAKLKSTTFNDPYLPLQWHYANTGQTGGTLGADINLIKAWQQTAGKPNVIVSVHDVGIDVKHEDLRQNVWVNQTELKGRAGVDDDGNGYVDDIYGYNFNHSTGAIDPDDHATHVMGTIAAVNNNGLGVAGVAGGTGKGDGVRVMSCEILGNGGGDIAPSYVYAADNGAVVSQNSWGYNYAGVYDQAVLDAIDYFIEEAGNYPGSPMKGGVVIFAAGNDGSNELHYPGAYPHTISVSSTNHKNERSYYSNYGTWVDIAAPGGETVETNKTGVLSTLPSNTYGYYQGTSMACPHVSGIAALIVSKYGGATFTSSELKRRLLSAVRSIDAANPDYTGLLGTGLVDAELALAVDGGKAPDTVKDLTVTSAVQDSIYLSWSVPADADDVKPFKFTLFLAEGNLDPKNLGVATSFSISNNDAAVGSKKVFNIGRLKPNTSYSVAIVAIDRWGNESPLSAVLATKTNDGPAISVSKSSISLAINTATNPAASTSFTVSNTGAGVLRWDSNVRQKTFYASYSIAGMNYPASTSSVKVKPQVAKIPYAEPCSLRPSSTLLEAKASTYKPLTWGYYDAWGSMFVIGEEDLKITNSAATKFTVPLEEGFNLTNISMLMKLNATSGPAILEILYGSNLETAKRIYAKEIKSNSPNSSVYNIALDEQFFFKYGETFWVVFHVPAGHKYPLGVAQEMDTPYSDLCRMSFDLGKHWVSMKDALGTEDYVWMTACQSLNKDLGKYITLTPASGEISGGKTTSINLSANASTLVNGTYKSNIVIGTNIKDSLVRIPVNLTVSGQVAKVSSPQTLDFGGVLIGRTKDLEITLSNTGLGSVSGLNMTLSNPQFKSLSYTSYISISALNDVVFKFRFAPTQAGNANCVVTLKNSKGFSYSFNLFGLGAVPPIIEVTPLEHQLGNAAVGDSLTASFSISNKGLYPLSYAMPSFASSINPDLMTGKPHIFGYTWATNLDGGPAAYHWDDISITGSEISDFFRNDVRNANYPVELGFSYPFYGQNFGKAYITKMGAVAFAPNGVMNGSTGGIGDAIMPDGYVTAMWDYINYNLGGKVYFKREPGKFITQYSDVMVGDWEIPMTFQIVLLDNGDAELIYKNINYSPERLVVGIDDPSKADGIAISSYQAPLPFTDETIIRITSPGYGAIKKVSAPQGILQPGDSKSVTIKIATTNLHEGSFLEKLNIISNDPAHSAMLSSFAFNLTSGGQLNMKFSKDTLNLGAVQQHSVVTGSVMFENAGSKLSGLQAVTISGNRFAYTGGTSISLKPLQATELKFSFNSSEKGDVLEQATVTDMQGNSHTLILKATVIAAPGIALNQAAIAETLEAGTAKTLNLPITNNGEAPLEVLVLGDSWINVKTPASTAQGSALPEFTYKQIKKNGSEEWNDIITTGKKIDDMMVEHPWFTLSLPFDFELYGEKRSKVEVGLNGIIYMDTPSQGYLTGSFIPSTDDPNYYIAPFWGMITPSVDIDPKAGIYYKFTDDAVILQYQGMLNMFGMGYETSYQCILYKDGTIKLIYRPNSFMDQNSIYALVGLENQDGTQGLQVMAYQEMTGDMTVTILPARRHVIPAGQTSNFEVTLNARSIFAGSYQSQVQVETNVYGKESITIPVQLTVTGEGKLTTPASVDFGEVMVVKEDSQPKTYLQPVNLANSGSAPIVITSLGLEKNDQEFVVEYLYTDPWWGGSSWVPLDPMNFEPIEVAPSKSAQLRVSLAPSGQNASLSDNLRVGYGENQAISIPITAKVTLPPVMSIAQDSIMASALNRNFKTTRVVNISNADGMSDLKYNVSLYYLRSKPSVDDNGNYVVPTQSSNTPANTTYPGFSNALEYDSKPAPDSYAGFDGEYQFYTVTKFVAPAQGFNVSRVMSWYNAGILATSRIGVEVWNSAQQVVATKSVDYKTPTDQKKGEYVSVDLDENVQILPNEVFYVAVKVPLDANRPQGIVNLDKTLPKTFYINLGGAWRDLTTFTNFSTTGLMVKVLEKNAATGQWVKMGSVASGSIAPGKAAQQNVMLESATAPAATSYALLEITSNDPAKSSKILPIQMNLNTAPIFDLIPIDTLSAKETLLSTYKIMAKDLDGDKISYSLPSAINGASIVAESDSIAYVKYTPTYDDAGVRTIGIKIADPNGNSSTRSIVVKVADTNRAPVAGTLNDKKYLKNGMPDSFSIASIFTDADADVLSYSVASSNASVVNTSVSKDGLLEIKPLSDGFSIVTVTANDGKGGTATASFVASVGYITTIVDPNDKQHDFTAYPNPCIDNVSISYTVTVAGRVDISLYTLEGRLAMNLVSENAAIGKNTRLVNLSNLTSGAYLCKIKLPDNTQDVITIIKR